MVTIQLTPGEFRQQIATHTHFRLKYDNPLSPLSVAALFDRAHVCLGGNTYLSLRGSDSSAVITHIQTIRKCRNEWGTTYLLQCLDYSGEVYTEVTYRLEGM